MSTSTINSNTAEFVHEDSGLHLGSVIRLPDGNLFTGMCITKKNYEHLDQAICSHYMMGRLSFDNGATWGNPYTVVAFPRQTGYINGHHYLLSRASKLHIFSYRIQVLDDKESKYIGDILHTRADDIYGTNAVTQKVECLDRYNGGLNSALQLTGGRLVVPFSTIPSGLHSFVCSTIYSDDEGVTWRASNDVQIADGMAHIESGLMEPVILELNDGRVLMLMRSTLGCFYYTLSADGGASWSEARPTAFRSSNAPTSLIRLENGDIVKIWNHCLGYRYIEGISYSRQTLHAAISEDDGVTWNGYREIVRRRQDDPPKVLNCYPFPLLLDNGRLLVKYYSVDSKEGANFNDPNAKLISFDPAFLKERTLTEDFANGLQGWSTDGNFANVGTYRLDPSSEEMNMLHMTVSGSDETAVAGLNFPYGSAGSLKLRMKSGSELAGAALILSETFLDAVHFTGKDEGIAKIKEVVLRDCARIELKGTADQWAELGITWDMEERMLRVSINGVDETAKVIEGGAGGFSYLTICLEGTDGEIRQLSIAQVTAESLRGGYSSIDFPNA